MDAKDTAIAVLSIVLAVIIIIGAIAIVSRAEQNSYCSKQGYSRKISVLGEGYCLSFDDGEIVKIAIKEFVDDEYKLMTIVTQE